ncbi:hypothetical protein DXG01_006136, partial [Tephrocybe rancida]
LSGFMTARFLLHIRKWEAKTSAGEGNGSMVISGLRFESSSHRVSFMDDIGDDPVRRARDLARLSAGDVNVIAEG